MRYPFVTLLTGALATAVLAACGGSGSGAAPRAPGDFVPGAPPVQTAATVLSGPDAYLLFPNPQLQPDGTRETDTLQYAQAYYRAVDAGNTRDTLDKWKAVNGFGTPAGPLGEVTVAMGDTRDLGYGRRMTARQNPDGTVAVLVENYQVNVSTGYGYTPANAEAAAVRDLRWHAGTNAIEYSPGSGGSLNYVKFYTFDGATGKRNLVANMDGRGAKAMPGICINCHGGRADALTPPGADGNPLFPLIANSVSQSRGDTLSRLHMLDLEHFDFSTVAGNTRADYEAAFKRINQMVLCTYPLAAPSTAPEDACRKSAGPNEWQGGADAMIKAAYGGPGLPSATFTPGYVPDGWLTAGQSSLYKSAVQPACMTCHMVRGSVNQNDIAFMSYGAFQGFAGAIRHHVYERGNMPLARIVADRFWGSDMAQITGTWLETQLPGYKSTDASGALLKPGRPIAIPGPDRVVPPGATHLSGGGSLYSGTYAWTLTGNPGNAATLGNANTATPTFTSNAAGSYVVQLVTANGGVTSAPVSMTIVVKAGLSPVPAAIRFNDLRPILANPNCMGCHSAGPGSFKPPVFFSEYDRNGDGAINDTDRQWFYREVRSRINFSDIAGSHLLQKPAGLHHAGRLRPGFDASLPPGDPGRSNYDLFLNWILNGAPL
ncbi:MAG TPA: hypothetical protein VIT92_12630 [Burkholderiaceae bacterium]